MSEIRSDNRQERHPKPTQDFERKFTNPGFVDWADVAELEAAYTLEYRKNKYFWINNQYFECLDDGVTYRLIGGSGGNGNCFITVVTPLVNGTILTVSAISGKTFDAAIVNTQAYTADEVTQGVIVDTELDFSLVGGYLANRKIVILYE